MTAWHDPMTKTFIRQLMIKLAWLGSVCLVSVLLANPVLAQEEAEAPAEGEEGGPSRYIDLKPAFIVNYGGQGRLRYLKTDIALRVSGGLNGPTSIRHHMPYIRHQLVMLLSKATEEEVTSMEGRELLRQNALEAVRQILMQEEGEQNVDDLLFNSFIVQR